MSRPTNEKKDKVIKVRVSEDTERALRSRGENMSATIRELVEEGLGRRVDFGFVDADRYGDSVGESVKESVSSLPDYFVGVCSLAKKKEKEFYQDLEKMFEDGKLRYEKGNLVVKVGFEYEEFLKWCEGKNANPAKVFENIMAEIKKM